MEARRLDRALRIIDRSTNTAIKIAGAPVVEAAGNFDTAQSNLTRLTTKERQERKERDAAVVPLGGIYDTVRSTTLARLPHADVSDRSKSLGTPDDVINAAEKLEDLLCEVGGVDEDHPLDGTGEQAPTGEAWALDLLRELRGPLSAAVKEADEASMASAALQKAQEACELARALLHTRIVAFRRVVRDAYGPESREYHSLRDRRMPGDDEGDDDDDDEEPPGGS